VWSTEDRRMLANMITETIIRMVGELLEYGPDEEIDIVRRTKRQLRLITLGVPEWNGVLSGSDSSND